MQQRKTHKKSRKGCQNCKRQHVKCDEQGPPCANCTARNIEESCSYGTRQALRATHATLSPSSSGSGELSSTHSRFDESQEFTPDSRRLLELELMHRWSTSTYKCFCMLPDDVPWMQVEVPRAALKHDFLLYCILALSALEMAIGDPNTPKSKARIYLDETSRYYGLASSSMREQLGNITKDNHHCIYIASMVVIVINMALPQRMPTESIVSDSQPPTMMDRMSVLFDLFLGAGYISLVNNQHWLLESPGSVSLLAAIEYTRTVGPELLDASTTDALSRLSTVVDSLVPDVMSVNAFSADSSKTYQSVVKQLRTCFILDAKEVKGFCISFPMFAGHEFALAFKKSGPLALFIVLHWGVLLHQLPDVAWWATSVGRNLVLEISEILMHSIAQTSMISEWYSNIGWAREQVGLPPVG